MRDDRATIRRLLGDVPVEPLGGALEDLAFALQTSRDLYRADALAALEELT